MENIHNARHFAIFHSQVLEDKKIVVIGTPDFNLFDLCAVIKAMQGRKFKTKVRFRITPHALPKPNTIINKAKR